MLGIIIGIVVAIGAVMFFKEESGVLGKIILSIITVAVGCVVIEMVTGMGVMFDIAKGCIALVVVLAIGKVIKLIFKS